MHVAHGGGRIELDHVVAVGDGVDGVFRRTVEAEVFSREVAVDREVGAGEGGGAERAATHALVEVGEAREVAFEHPEEGHHPVGEEDRLARLHVRVARHDHVDVGAGGLDEDGLKLADRLLDFADFMAEVHLRGGRRLVVAATTRVQTAAGRADDFRHALLDGHVDVFVLDGEDELAGADFLGNLVKAAADRFGILGADDVLTGEHRGVHLAVLNVERADALLERDRGVEGFHEFVGGKIEAAGTALAVFVGHCFLLEWS